MATLHANHASGSEQRTAANARESVAYTCPMHPQIRQIGPGNCPICGMALEPRAGPACSKAVAIRAGTQPR